MYQKTEAAIALKELVDNEDTQINRIPPKFFQNSYISEQRSYNKNVENKTRLLNLTMKSSKIAEITPEQQI